MKNILLTFLMCLFLTGCASIGIAEEPVVEPAPVPEIIEPPETSENSNPSFAQINQSKMDLLSWQLRFWKENQRAIELEYTGLCYKDVRHGTAVNEINRVTKQMQHLLLP